MNASFSAAIAWLKAGYKVRRACWPQDNFIRFVGYEVYVFVSDEVMGPEWSVPHDSLLAEDWQLVRE